MARSLRTGFMAIALVVGGAELASGQVLVAPAPVISYYAAPAVSYYAPAPVAPVAYYTPAAPVAIAAPAVSYYTTPAPVPAVAPAVSYYGVAAPAVVPAPPAISTLPSVPMTAGYFTPVVTTPATVSRGLFGRTIVRTPFYKVKY